MTGASENDELAVMTGASIIKPPHFTLPPIQRVSDTFKPFLTVELTEVGIHSEAIPLSLGANRRKSTSSTGFVIKSAVLPFVPTWMKVAPRVAVLQY